MVSAAERCELDRPDATIRYWVSGPRQAPRIVLLHGATLDHHAWDAQVAALSGRYRVVVPDLRGHGESTMAGRFRFDDAVADVQALLDTLDASDGEVDGTGERSFLALGGLSLGGNLAQEVVYRSPGRVDALVVADSTCNTAVRNPLAVPVTLASLGALGMSSHDQFVRRAAEVTSPHEDVRRYVAESNAERSNGETVQILGELLRGLHADPEYRLPVPTLLLHGDGDRIGDIIDGAKNWAYRDEQIEYVVVPDAGHASNQDNPAAFTGAVQAFLDRVREATENGVAA